MTDWSDYVAAQQEDELLEFGKPVSAFVEAVWAEMVELRGLPYAAICAVLQMQVTPKNVSGEALTVTAARRARLLRVGECVWQLPPEQAQAADTVARCCTWVTGSAYESIMPLIRYVESLQ